MDRLVRRRGAGAGAVRGGRPAPGRPGPVRDRGQALLRGLLQRHAVAALPRRHRAAAVPPPVVGGVRDRQPALRAGRGGAGGARRDRLGARLPAPAGPADAARAARRRPDRLLQPHPVPRLRDLRPAAVAAAGGRGPARRRPARLPAPGRRHQLPAGLPPGRRPDHQGVDRAGRRAGRLAGVQAAAFPISIDSAGLDEIARRDDVRKRAAEIREALGDPGLVLLGVDRLDYTKGILHRLRAYGELLRRRAARPAAGAGPGGQPEPGAGRGVPDAARRGRGDGGPDQRRARARWATPPCTTCTSPTRARRWPRCTWPPTSCW